MEVINCHYFHWYFCMDCEFNKDLIYWVSLSQNSTILNRKFYLSCAPCCSFHNRWLRSLSLHSWETGVSLHGLVPNLSLLCIPFLNVHVSYLFRPTTRLFLPHNTQTTSDYSFFLSAVEWSSVVMTNWMPTFYGPFFIHRRISIMESKNRGELKNNIFSNCSYNDWTCLWWVSGQISLGLPCAVLCQDSHVSQS